MTKQVKLYNKGKSTIHGTHPDALDESGKAKKYSLAPDSTGLFAESEAKKLRRLYPTQIVSLEDVKKQFDDDSAEKEPERDGYISPEEVDKRIADAVAAALEAERESIAAEKEAGDDYSAGDPEEKGNDSEPARGRGRPAKKAA